MEIRNHPLAGQGTAFYGALKPGKVTVARFCNIDGAYKLFLLSGEAVAMDRCTKGVTARGKEDRPGRENCFSLQYCLGRCGGSHEGNLCIA